MCKIDGDFVPRDVPGRDGTVSKNPGRPVPWQAFELVQQSLCPGTMKELLSRDKKVLPVPLSRKVALSRPVGNPKFTQPPKRTNPHCDSGGEKPVLISYTKVRN